MKFKNYFSAFMLLVAACLAFSFKPIEKRNNNLFSCEWFVFVDGSAQSCGAPATLSAGRTKDNYVYYSPTVPSFTYTGKLLGAICVDRSAGEIDNRGTLDDTSDDLPKVEDNTTNIYAALGAAYNPTPNPDEWNDVTSGYGSAQVKTKGCN